MRKFAVLEMAYPKIIAQSKKLQRIPNPSDFALDSVVDNIFSGTVYRFRDFVEEGYYKAADDDDYDERDDGSRVLDNARNIVLHLETNPEKILSRQEILSAFMDSSDLIKLVQETTIERKSNNDYWLSDFNKLVERAEGLVNYLSELTVKIPSTENTQLEAFRKYVSKLSSKNKRIQSLKTVLKDIKEDGNLKITWGFLARKDYWNSDIIKYDLKGYPDILGKLSSGKEVNAYDVLDSGWCNKLTGGFKIPYDSLCAEAVQQVKNNRGKNLVRFETPTDLEINADQKTGLVTGKATYHKFDFFGSISSFKMKTKPVETYWLFDSKKVNKDIFTDSMTYLKNKEYSNFLENFDTELKDLAGAVVELRYLATAANYFNELKEKGVQTAVPKIASTDSKIMNITNLIDPNLVEKTAFGDIVANDVLAGADKNLYVITGPNNNGKTTYMNAIGVAQAMFQAGLNVLAQSAEMSPKDNIFTHYIRPGDLVSGESRYAHELSRIKEIFKKATGYSLFLMDESFSGTAPDDAKVEADAVVRKIGRLGSTGFVATHFHNLIDSANGLSYAQNIHCVANKNEDELVYTYKIAEGSSTQSNGIYLARKMGADEDGLDAILDERVQKEHLKLRE
jgi:DNA mismatch repair ATPase MutS